MHFDKSELEIKLVNTQVYKVILLLHVHNSAPTTKCFMTEKSYDFNYLFQLLVITYSY